MYDKTFRLAYEVFTDQLTIREAKAQLSEKELEDFWFYVRGFHEMGDAIVHVPEAAPQPVIELPFNSHFTLSVYQN